LYTLLFVGAALFLTSRAAAVQNITLGWEPSDDPTVAGYHVYCRTAGGGPYGTTVHVTIDTRIRIDGLVEGTTYFFIVTAYDNTGLESLPSNEVSYTVPRAALRMDRIQAGGLPMAFSIVANSTPPAWTLEASEDLRTWKPVATGSNEPANVSVLVAQSPSMLFRLKSGTPGTQLVMQRQSPSAFPGSYLITTKAATPPQWTLEYSRNLPSWSEFTSGTNLPLKIAVIVSQARSMFFRLKSQ
jgi:hypothetical protein